MIVRIVDVGRVLLMAGTDLLDTPTDTVVAQRSETGQGILGAKEGKGMWVWSAVVLAVLSSRMSAGAITAIFLYLTSHQHGRRDSIFKTNGIHFLNSKISFPHNLRHFTTTYNSL